MSSENKSGEGKWGDLATRSVSGVVLAFIGLAAIYQGGYAILALVMLVVGVIGWEILRMVAPDSPKLWAPLGVLMALSIFGASMTLNPIWQAVTLLGALLITIGAIGEKADRVRALLYIGWVLVAGFGLILLRVEGMMAVLWLVAIVVTSDMAGYFVGRIVGGPKFWPAVSPKKTWSGTVAGWVGAALVGFFFIDAVGPMAPVWSMPLAFAGQMGDAAESALKRAKGVKDASDLIPGHGGFFDRFDALMGASLAVGAILLLQAAL
ncbi:MAG: phosphatidate cytidylyltransferase [Rhodobacterales bacterium]|nr:MAG: phosphatidate cytidylyltransferase [Rhodobacterales bacterium]